VISISRPRRMANISKSPKLGKGSWAAERLPHGRWWDWEKFQGSVITLWRRETDIFLARANGEREERLASGKNPAVRSAQERYLRPVVDPRRSSWRKSPASRHMFSRSPVRSAALTGKAR